MEKALFAKILIIAIIFIVLCSLAFGLYFLLKDKSESKRTAYALTVRIALSVALFILLFIGFYFGFISPHGIGK